MPEPEERDDGQTHWRKASPHISAFVPPIPSSRIASRSQLIPTAHPARIGICFVSVSSSGLRKMLFCCCSGQVSTFLTDCGWVLTVNPQSTSMVSSCYTATYERMMWRMATSTATRYSDTLSVSNSGTVLWLKGDINTTSEWPRPA
jgi:hypothetical protein